MQVNALPLGGLRAPHPPRRTLDPSPRGASDRLAPNVGGMSYSSDLRFAHPMARELKVDDVPENGSELQQFKIICVRLSLPRIYPSGSSTSLLRVIGLFLASTNVGKRMEYCMNTSTSRQKLSPTKMT